MLQEELEEARSALAMEVSAYKIRIKQLSNDLLFRLSGSKVPQADVLCIACPARTATAFIIMNLTWHGVKLQGNLLDDSGLVDVLAATKASSEEVTRNLLVASNTRVKIEEACEEFRPVAARAALMYFLISSLSTINCMYQVSN